MALGISYLEVPESRVQGREAQWPNDLCAGLQIKWSRYEPWLGHCVVFLEKTLNSHSAFLHPGE